MHNDQDTFWSGFLNSSKFAISVFLIYVLVCNLPLLISTFFSPNIWSYKEISKEILFYEPFQSFTSFQINNDPIPFPIHIDDFKKVPTGLKKDIKSIYAARKKPLSRNFPNSDALKELNKKFENGELKQISRQDILDTSTMIKISRRWNKLFFGWIQFSMILIVVWIAGKYRIKYPFSKSTPYWKVLNGSSDALRKYERFIQTGLMDGISMGIKDDPYIHPSAYINKLEFIELKDEKGNALQNKECVNLATTLGVNTDENQRKPSADTSLYNDLNSLIRDFKVTGKAASLNRLSQIEEQLELKHENEMRHLEWALFIVPTIGFIGTVIGISGALSDTGLIFEGNPQTALPIIASKLSVAFDTTLLALVGAAIMYSWKRGLDHGFYMNILSNFSGYTYKWIVQSVETDEAEDLRKLRVALDQKKKELTSMMVEMIETFSAAGHDIQSAKNRFIRLTENL